MSDSFRDLIVWQKAIALVTNIYRATESFPTRERYRPRNLEFLTQETFEDLIEKAGEVSRLLSGLIRNLQHQIDNPGSPNS